MPRYLTAMLIAAVGTAWPALGSAPDSPAERSASLAHDSLVMRLSKDEFRIAFGVHAQRCVSNDCNGVIHYRVEWQTEDGTVISEFRRGSYNVLPHSMRTMTVDRRYFDTAKGAHTTNVVQVTVDMITCVDGAYANSTPRAAAASARSARLLHYCGFFGMPRGLDFAPATTSADRSSENCSQVRTLSVRSPAQPAA